MAEGTRRQQQQQKAPSSALRRSCLHLKTRVEERGRGRAIRTDGWMDGRGGSDDHDHEHRCCCCCHALNSLCTWSLALLLSLLSPNQTLIPSHHTQKHTPEFLLLVYFLLSIACAVSVQLFFCLFLLFVCQITWAFCMKLTQTVARSVVVTREAEKKSEEAEWENNNKIYTWKLCNRCHAGWILCKLYVCIGLLLICTQLYNARSSNSSEFMAVVACAVCSRCRRLWLDDLHFCRRCRCTRRERDEDKRRAEPTTIKKNSIDLNIHVHTGRNGPRASSECQIEEVY